MSKTIDYTADIIDVRDLIERYEELEDNQDTPEAKDEFVFLSTILHELCGNGGDEQWRGDWYPVTLIREDHFTSYIEDFIHDCYDLPKEMRSGQWPYRHMTFDYEAAAQEAKVDYDTIDIDGAEYFYR